MQEYILENSELRVKILNYGLRIKEFYVKSRAINISCCYQDNEAYLHDRNYFGATIGPNANRIAGGKFKIDNVEYQWEQNNGEQNLHSFPFGVHMLDWTLKSANPSRLVFTLNTHVPFEVAYEAIFELQNASLDVQYKAVSPQKALLNLTNHNYFNLNGIDGDDIDNHEVKFAAGFYTPFKTNSIPTGEVLSVEGTAFDFRSFRNLGAMFKQNAETLRNTRGYDHNFVSSLDGYKVLAVIQNDCLGLEISSNSDAFQFYTGNNIVLDGVPSPHRGLCIEPQFVPNSVNIAYLKSPLHGGAVAFNQRINYRIYELA